MGQILPGPINNRVGYGSLKKPEAGPGRIWVFVIPGLDLTCLNIKLPKTPYIYIYIYKLKKTLLPLIFHTQPPSISLTASFSSPSLTHGLTLFSLSHSLLLTDSSLSSNLCHSPPPSHNLTAGLKLCHRQSQALSLPVSRST